MPYKDRKKQSAYQVAWVRRRRESWFTENGPCVDCGSPDELELDHVNAALKVSHRIWSWSAARRDAELRKCVARCRPCHKRKTVEAGELDPVVGEANGSAKLTAPQVRLIRSLRQQGVIYDRLAQMFAVDPRTVKNVCHRRTWKHVA